MKSYNAGIDVGSTTVKLVIIDGDEIIFSDYRRHCSKIQETLASLMAEAEEQIGSCYLKLMITGSGSINLGKALGIGFVQEVTAVADALKKLYPQTDVAIELGGEDAKIIYFEGTNVEERMNGVCAGGTGSFIDQMAALLQTDAEGLNAEASRYTQIYPIAARCGVFAKTDIQPLVNEGADVADLAASIFQAVVNQTISGLACGKPIRGNIAFLGGPLHFLPELKKAFIRTLNLASDNIVDPDNSHLFAALGAAYESEECTETVSIKKMRARLESGISMEFEIKRLPPLFETSDDYEDFRLRHAMASVEKEDLSGYSGKCYLGIDAGSTTTKMALIGEKGQLLYSFYSGNMGNPVKTAQKALLDMKKAMPQDAVIGCACSTGYGEALLKSAFSLDEGEVETIAHSTAASFFDPDVDCVLDIGGQDMKCIKIKQGTVENVILNEACSSGCGSFIENFATSLGYSAEEFAKEALYARNPVDLGTRCTVFMNSNVKQAQKEGASVSDISAGLAYSVVKNALFKVIKLGSASDLGEHVVVQGGTFHNTAVLRAFEIIAGCSAVCPDIAGIMGAFGAALIAKDRAHEKTGMLSFEEIEALQYDSSTVRCGRCSNNCLLTINRFSGGRKHISGNRCERPLGGEEKKKAPNLVEYKLKRIFGYKPLEDEKAFRGKIGIPRVLNMYENYPFWATFFKTLGFSVVLSPFSSRKIYELGMESIPSESECYPAKLAHGHVQWLINRGVNTIFHPCVFYEKQETDKAQNHFNCPIVVSYAENLKNNIEDISNGSVRFLRPFMAFTDIRTVKKRLTAFCRETWQIPASETAEAVEKAWNEQISAKADIVEKGKELLAKMEEEKGRGIVIAGRPYHTDPEINHGIPEMISSYGLYVFTEDSLPVDFEPMRPLRANDQWVYHSRLYTAAEFVSRRDDLELVQFNSFGCGLDAVTADQVSEILTASGKLFTLLKIDEVNNLGAARIRIRSLIAAMNLRKNHGISSEFVSPEYQRVHFTKTMRKEGYTIIAPQMSPIHFDLIGPLFKKYGYNVVILSNDNRSAIDTGLKYVNNDACFPSITTIGQIMEAVTSGQYDTNRLAIMMTQTGGCCRASNYVGFIRRALKKAGMSHIPVISLNLNGMEKNEGFRLSPEMILDAGKAIVLGDLMMKCLYRVRPYETEKGSADRLHEKWKDICIDYLLNRSREFSYSDVCRGIVREFDELPIDETIKKPRVGIVGEILVKYMPLANNRLVELLEKEGAEAVVPDLIDFLNYSFFNSDYKHKYLGKSWAFSVIAKVGVEAVTRLRKAATEALQKSKRFSPSSAIAEKAELAKKFLSLGNQYGEGWFLTGEMADFLTSGINNIVCIQPFACLPNHVVGKGVIKALKKAYPGANIVAVDYDPGASEVNQLNRIKLMLSSAKRKLAGERFGLGLSN